MPLHICRICGTRLPLGALQTHLKRCLERNADYVDALRPSGHIVEGDPELARFAREEGDVYNRRPGTRRRPR